MIGNKNEKISDDIEIKKIKLSEIDYNILSGSAIYFNELKFNILKEKYPNLYIIGNSKKATNIENTTTIGNATNVMNTVFHADFRNISF